MNTSATSPSSILELYYSCTSSTTGMNIYTAWFALYLLLLPLFLLVLYIGFTKWRQQRNSATITISHCDVFTLHMAMQEIIMTVGASLYMFGLHRRHYLASASGCALIAFTTSAQATLHSLTCMERYLAVVHPITYLRLKRRAGVTVRNVSIVAVWLLSTVYMLFIVFAPNFVAPIILHFLWLSVVLTTVSFCSISVLCVLIRPGPGERSKNRKRTGKSKLSAFTTIMTILGVLQVRLVQLLVLAFWPFIKGLETCVLPMSMFWVSLPTSLVLPLLFLHRELCRDCS